MKIFCKIYYACIGNFIRIEYLRTLKIKTKQNENISLYQSRSGYDFKNQFH